MAKTMEKTIVADEVRDDKPELPIEDEPFVLDETPDPDPRSEDPRISRLADSVQGLQEILKTQLEREAAEKPPKPETPTRRTLPRKDINEIKKRLKEGVWDSPDDLIEEMINAKLINDVGPLFQKLDEENKQMKKIMGRQMTGANERDKIVLDKWGDEVDKLSEKMPYEQAVRQVKLDHIDDLIEERLKGTEPKAEGTGYSGAGRMPTPAGRPERVTYKPINGHTAEEFQKILKSRAISEKQLASYWMSKGWLKETRS